MSQPLALKYRPRTFSDMVGQTAPRVVLSRMVATDEVFPALLMYGALGSGKTSAARVLAAALNCSAPEPAARPCGSCPSCRSIVAGTSSDVTEVDAASSGMADDIRKLRDQVRYAASGRYRVVVIDEAHAMSAAGSEALLKVLEEPPPGVVFVLVTTEMDKISDTIASRCRSLQFTRIPASHVAARLLAIAGAEGRVCSAELADAIAARTEGVMRSAINLLEQCFLVGVTNPAQLDALLGSTDHGVAVLAALGSGSWPEAFAAAHAALEVLPSSAALVGALVATLRRAMVAGSGAEVVPPLSGAEQALVAKLGPARAASAMAVIWAYHTDVAPAADSAAAVDLLIAVLGRAFARA